MLKKLISVITVGLLVFGCVSCGEEKILTKKGEHARKGEFDFTETIGNIVFCNNVIEMPCSFSGLGEGFTAEGGEFIESLQKISFRLEYDGEEVGSVVLDTADKNADVSGLNIIKLDISATERLSINGLDCSDTFDKIEQTFGKPTYTNDFHAKYEKSENKYVEFIKPSKNSSDITAVIIFNN